MYKKLVSPDFKVTFNNLQIESGFYVEYQSSEDIHADQCILTPFEEVVDVMEQVDISEVIVEMGAEDDYDTILQGYGFRLQNSESIVVKDGIVRMEQTAIRETFLDCTPQEILRYVLAQCGISDYELSDQEYGRHPFFSVANKNAVQTVLAVNNAWELDAPFFFWDGVFYWNRTRTQDELYEIDSANILELEPQGDHWTADIVGIPWLHQGQYIMVTDPEFYGTAKIQKCVVKSDGRGIVDMYIQFKEADIDA